MIRISNLKKSFGKNEILKGIDLTINDGEVVTIIGPSGTGKTTLLRCINFLERAEQGVITIDDITTDCTTKDHKQILALRRKTAMVFQSFNLFRNKTCVENVMEGLVLVKKVPKDEARKRAMIELERVGMADKADSYPIQISGGQQQRVAIARAIALDPTVILFDEPTSALDPELTGEVLSTIRKVSKLGITMLIVTHEIEFARGVSNRVIFMADGYVIESGTPEEIFLNPQSERTKQFVSRVLSPGSVC